jgi:hypothetical protein
MLAIGWKRCTKRAFYSKEQAFEAEVTSPNLQDHRFRISRNPHPQMLISTQQDPVKNNNFSVQAHMNLRILV